VRNAGAAQAAAAPALLPSARSDSNSTSDGGAPRASSQQIESQVVTDMLATMRKEGQVSVGPGTGDMTPGTHSPHLPDAFALAHAQLRMHARPPASVSCSLPYFHCSQCLDSPYDGHVGVGGVVPAAAPRGVPFYKLARTGMSVADSMDSLAGTGKSPFVAHLQQHLLQQQGGTGLTVVTGATSEAPVQGLPRPGARNYVGGSSPALQSLLLEAQVSSIWCSV
jgi:hypothetical protein